MNARLFALQRGTAIVMAPLVIVHLAVMFYATRNGLSAADILARLRGSYAWAAFYGAFAVAAGLHAQVGLRQVMREWLGVRGVGLDYCAWAVGASLIALGLRAAYAVTFG